MRIQNITIVLLCIVGFAVSGFGQKDGMLTRKITRSDKFGFGAGGTVSVTGAPQGNIEIVGGLTNEIEITAQIELKASSQDELSQLEVVTGFATDETNLKTAVISVGTNNKLGDKKMWKKFPSVNERCAISTS